jgi:hypothetical protein
VNITVMRVGHRDASKSMNRHKTWSLKG